MKCGNYKEAIKSKKGVAGLEFLIAVVTVLFVTGILIMAYTIAGTKMADTVTDETAVQTINDTTNAIGDIVDWFPTFIVIAAVVVLILMIVLVVVAVRGAGLMGGAGGA